MKHSFEKTGGGFAEATEYKCKRCKKVVMGIDEWIWPGDLKEKCPGGVKEK